MLINGHWTNRTGMVFVPVPGADVLFSIWETRKRDYTIFAQANRGIDDSWENVVFRGATVSAA